MDPLLQLAVMWLANQGQAKRPTTSKAPRWPTPTSPPPMPAFKPSATAPTDTATPLAELHATPPVPPAATTDVRAATKAPSRPRAPRIVPGMLTSTLPVATLQRALNARGAKLVPDGLYGPKTAAAWVKAAASRGLPASIVRKGPKLADVATHTFDALSLPPIP